MTVKELFKSLDRESLISEYLCYCGEPNTSRRRKVFNNLLDSFESLDVQPSTSQIIFCTPLLGDHQFDSSLLEKDELISAVSESSLPQIYAYELCPMKDVLGFSVSRACIYAFGEYKVACAILDELTFFGCDLEVQRKVVTQESNRLHEAVSQIKEGLAGGISFDQALKDIGFEDDRKEFEQKFDTNRFLIESEVSRKLLTELCKLEVNYIQEDLE